MSDQLDELVRAARERGDWSSVLRALESLGLDLELFIVYYDLRRRGKRVRLGVRPRTLIYEEPSGKLFEVLVLAAGARVSLKEIIEWSRRASADSHEPVIAVVDENGGVTYYESRVVTQLR